MLKRYNCTLTIRQRLKGKIISLGGFEIMEYKSDEVISATDMIRNFSYCRKKTKKNGRLLIIRNNKPDMVLLTIDGYEKLVQNIKEDIKNGD
jgi:hypothetical protein